MGAIHFSLHDKLLECLKHDLPLDIFFETGTYRANTTREVARHFDHIYTVELSTQLYREACTVLGAYRNVTALEGSSPTILRQYRNALANRSVLYWLDAHWCGTGTGSDSSECPLLDELDAIRTLNDNSVILVDDARFFLGPAPHPHKSAHWPTICQVTDKLRTLSLQHDVWIINDVLIFAPVHIADSVVAYGREYGVDLNILARMAAQSQIGVRQANQ